MSIISFQFDIEKFIQAAAYVMGKCTGSMTRKRLLKLLYFADREHLLRYGRPILNDYYINMDQGPVASQAYDLIKGNHHTWSQDALGMFEAHFSVRGIHITMTQAEVPRDLLSSSDVEVLNETIAKYGRMTADHLSAISHRHKAWLNSERNRRIDYRLFFDDENANEIRDIVEEDQSVRSVARHGSRQFSESRSN